MCYAFHNKIFKPMRMKIKIAKTLYFKRYRNLTSLQNRALIKSSPNNQFDYD